MNINQISSNITLSNNFEIWPVDRLIPYARNSRTHSDEQVAQIAASIAEFGFNAPILVDSNSGIIAGHGRLLAARKLNLIEVPVIVLDHLTDAQRRAYILADNKIALNAGWDEEMLRVELNALGIDGIDLALTGFSDEELEDLLYEEDANDGLTDDDAVPEEQESTVTVPGHVWIMGDHRLHCGDATSMDSIKTVLASGLADLVFTDPPYNVDYSGYTEEHLTIQNDRMSDGDFRQFLESSFLSLRAAIKPGASLYVCHSSSWQREFQNALEAAGLEARCQIIWAKNTFAWGFGRYKFQHEPIFYCHVAGQKDPWYGDKSQSTLWLEKKPAANRLHPTMKPVELVERALTNSSKAGDVVFDPFGGSGTTLIACEKSGRHARLLELEPKYSDVIVRRWQAFTGEVATLESTQQTFAEVESERGLSA